MPFWQAGTTAYFAYAPKAPYLIPENTQGAPRGRSALPLATEGTQEGDDSPDERNQRYFNADDTLLVRAMNWGMESCSGRRVIISSSKKPAGAGWLASKI